MSVYLFIKNHINQGIKNIQWRIQQTNIEIYNYLNNRKLRVFVDAVRNKYGLEIGGPSIAFRNGNILPIYSHIRGLDGVNFSNETFWEGKIKEGYNFEFEAGKMKGYQYIRDGTDLKSIEDCKYDFVLSCHNLEHIANPLKALYEWIRIIKVGGCLLLVLPDKNGTFDHNRQVTTLEHMINDYRNNIDENDMTHLNESLELTDYDHPIMKDNIAGNYESFKSLSLDNFKKRVLHHHVFDVELTKQLILYLQLKIIAFTYQEPHNIIIMGKKRY